MKLFDEFATWFKDKDQQIMELHMRKEANYLSKTYKSLEEEHVILIEYLHRIEHLLDIAEKYVPSESKITQGKVKHVPDFEKWFTELESRLDGLFSDKKKSLDEEEQAILIREFSTMQAEKSRLENRIHKFHEIMAKTLLLINDLNEDLSKKLTRGHSLAAVGEVLLKKFSREFREDYGLGRSSIRRFLEGCYKIDKHESRELFIILERAGILRFRTKFPDDFTNQPLVYYTSEIGDTMEEYMGMSPQIFGFWEINA